MNKYAVEDTAILWAIDKGKSKYNEICCTTGLEWRLVDRRLQAMRRKLLIQFDTKEGWSRRTL